MTLTCPHCGRAFECNPEGDCWCKQIPPMLSVPEDAQAVCLCPCQLRSTGALGTKAIETKALEIKE